MMVQLLLLTYQICNCVYVGVPCVHMLHGCVPGDRGQRWPLKLELSTQCWCWQLTCDILEEQCVLLTAEPLLWSLLIVFHYCLAYVGMHMMQGAW